MKGSKNREKARLLVARQHEYVANGRRDTLHKLSERLTREYGTIRMENLNIRGMLKNHSLAKGIADSGWGMLVGMCQYRAPWRGGAIEQIDRFYPSTKTCHVGGYKNEELTLKVRAWTCPQCRATHDRDVNAARAILAAPTVVPRKQSTASQPASLSRSHKRPPERRKVTPAERPSDAKAVGPNAGLGEVGSPALSRAG